MPRLVALMAPLRLWMIGGVLLGSLAVGANVALMAVSAWLISRAAIATNVADLALAITAVRVLAISRAAFRYLERYVTHRAALRILAHLRVWFYHAIEPLAPARLEMRRSGDLLARIVRDVDTLEDFYVRVALPPLVAALVTIAVTLVLGAFDALLGLILLMGLLLGGLVVPLVTRRMTWAASAHLIEARAELDAALVDDIRGMADLVAFDRASWVVERQRALGRRLDVAGERLAVMRGLGLGLVALTATLTGIVVLGFAIGLVTGGRLDGVFLAVVTLGAIASFEAVQPISQAVQQLDPSLAAAGRLFELIDAEPEVSDPPRAAGLPGRHGLSIRGLRFRYGPDEPFVLAGLDLDIPAGTSLGLVGPSGSGKSTLVSLLLRFREYSHGRIILGGTELRALAADDVRAAIAVVPQRVDLFDVTIRDNLALADPGLTDERMIAACRIAEIHDVIEDLPAGYDTRIGEDGVTLSGGERQRLAIARAIIKDAPILILDEATAHLDPATEGRVMDGLARVMAGRTTLIITHRPVVAARADRVVRLG